VNQPAREDFKDHFSQGAAAYAAHRPTYPLALVDFLADISPQRKLAWDCGCGSGQLSVLLGERFEHVVATDASSGQLANATLHAAVEYRCARAEASGLADAIADLAVSAQAAHWFNLPAYYAEVRRVAGPGAVIAMVTYGNMITNGEILSILHKFYRDVTGPYWDPQRRQVEDGYRSFLFPFEEIQAPKLEIHRDWTLPELFGYVETWSAVGGLIKALGRGPMDRLHDELARAWGPATLGRTMTWPLSMRVGRVG
jgi:SAM-dependent methyltransferase